MTPTGRGRLLWIALCIVLVLTTAVVTRSLVLRHAAGSSGSGGPADVRYRCPMHPAMQSDKPGDCPICGMRMVPVENGAPAGSTPPGTPASPGASPSGKRVIYRSTMNPGEVSDRPGRDSMGMEMQRVEIDEPAAGASNVEGLATIRVDEGKQRMIGVKTGVVARVPFVRTIRTVGRVTPDETGLHHVHTKIDGWVETLFVNATGVTVRKGDPLLTIYSPELVATQEEYLVALRARGAMGGGTVPEIARRENELLESTRRRLLLFDLAPAQIDELERTGVASRTLTLPAPISGYVTQRNVTQGEKIDSGMTLLDIADLSRVWVIASIYEYELPFVRVGQSGEVTLSYLPGRTYRGRVGLVYPTLEGATRTAQVRLEFSNPDLALKPEMYAEVQLESDLGERLAVPTTAILASGTRNVVFVTRPDGTFEPREVRLGLRLPDTVEVLEGVAAGETVVTSGNFLIDSESKLKAALDAVAAPKNRP